MMILMNTTMGSGAPTETSKTDTMIRVKPSPAVPGWWRCDKVTIVDGIVTKTVCVANLPNRWDAEEFAKNMASGVGGTWKTETVEDRDGEVPVTTTMTQSAEQSAVELSDVSDLENFVLNPCSDMLTAEESEQWAKWTDHLRSCWFNEYGYLVRS